MRTTAVRDQDTLTADTILDLLANKRRRYLLYALQGYDEPVALNVLSREVAGWEHDLPPEEVSQKDYKSVYVSSVQCHVPKMDDVGVVEHDPSDHTVELAENYELLEPYLRLVILDEPEHSRLYESLPVGEEGLLQQAVDTVARLKP